MQTEERSILSIPSSVAGAGGRRWLVAGLATRWLGSLAGDNMV